jgi:hypothetical protein
MKKAILICTTIASLLYICGCADDRPAPTSTTTTTEETTVHKPMGDAATTTETETTRPAY